MGVQLVRCTSVAYDECLRYTCTWDVLVSVFPPRDVLVNTASWMSSQSGGPEALAPTQWCPLFKYIGGMAIA